MFPDTPSLPIDDMLDDPNRNEDFESRDIRRPQRLLDSRRQADGELSDSDDEGEGGRRNHMRYHDSDSVEDHKFGMGVGILVPSTSTNMQTVGPSGHTTVARVLSSTSAGSAAMDVDTTPSLSDKKEGNETEGATPAPMTLDEPSLSATSS